MSDKGNGDTTKPQDGAASNRQDEALLKAKRKPENLTEEEWRSNIAKYGSTRDFPFELNEQVWIVAPSSRAPLGPFQIAGFLPDFMFRLKDPSTGNYHPDAVSGNNLTRDPYSVVMPR
ncbi:hypothetical protein MMC10_003380 [Thelotrema lepadinum]|nr:hypothetical protein [Thelotrema lepadinum]